MNAVFVYGRWLLPIGAAVAVVSLGFLFLTRPAALPADRIMYANGSPASGRMIFAAAGCGACHRAPNTDSEGNFPVLSGGKAFPTRFGTFYAPNISSHAEHGIGDWDFEQFAHAVIVGVSPEGAHYYPAFPYPAYALMARQDLVDLFAYIQGLPASAIPSKDHDLRFPVSIRRSVGIWKTLSMPDGYYLAVSDNAVKQRGRYLVEALAHCQECHTPRNVLGGLDRSRWMQGATDPAGSEKIPGLTPDELDWSKEDLIIYLTTGLTPDYDSVSGDMAVVIDNLAKLPKSDINAIATYLKLLP